jgi:hypothetical protein
LAYSSVCAGNRNAWHRRDVLEEIVDDNHACRDGEPSESAQPVASLPVNLPPTPALDLGDRTYLDLANRLWWKTTDYLYDRDEHLYYRDSRYFKTREKNGKNVFWSRP